MKNPQAFPAFLGGENRGMTLRDYFAAAAINGIASSERYFNPATDVAKAYMIADAMLKEREQYEERQERLEQAQHASD